MRLIDCFSTLISFALHTERKPEREADKIYAQYIDFVQQCRSLCDEHGYSQYLREHALFAIVVWIDEQRLCDERLRVEWIHFSLQRELFNTTNGGDDFYTRFVDISEEDVELREVYIHCLVLGFRGNMYNRPEMFEDFCQKTLGCDSVAIGAILPDPLFPESYNIKTPGRFRRRRNWTGLSSVFFVIVSVGLLGCFYFLGQRSLGMVLASLKSIGL